MSRWGWFRKFYILLAVVITLLFTWPSSFIYTKLPPAPIIKLPPAPQPEPEPTPQNPYEEFYYDIYVNDVLMDRSILTLKDNKGQLWIPVSSYENFNFSIPDIEPKDYFGEKFLSLNSFPGVTYHIDLETLSLKINAPLAAFKQNVLNLGASKTITPSLPPWGGYFNYNFLTVNQSSTNNVSGAFKLGLFSPVGVGTSTFVWRTAKTTRPWVRLLSTWRVDYPETMRTLLVGDAISEPTNWSGSLNYGGIKWGRNFDTQPAYITFPLPSYRGTAIVPSVLNLYVNGNQAGQRDIEPGPFEINDIPMVDGAGNVRIVTSDILGRRHVVTASYYINTTLLKKGLTNYALDLGTIRQDLGVFSNNYRNLIGAFTYERGFTDNTTIGFHGEALNYVQAAGITVKHLLWKLGILSSSAAMSHSESLGTGGLFSVAFQRQTSYMSFGGSAKYTTTNFTQQGLPEDVRSEKLIAQAFGSVVLGNGSLSFNYTKIDSRNDLPTTSFITVTGTTALFHAISVNATLRNSLSGPRNKSFFLNLSYAFDSHLFLNGNYTDNNGERVKTVQLTRQLPQGPGYGYDITASRDAADSDAVGLTLQNDIGTYAFRGNRVGNQTDNTNTYTYSLDVKGGAVYMDNQLELSREINSSFGFVKIPGYGGVDIYWENQLQGKTNKDGYLMLPNLLPFQKSKINIDPNTVPLNAHIDSYEKFMAPYLDSGVLVSFDISTIHNVIMTLKQTTGDLVPEGAAVSIEGSDEPFVVGMDGQLYITGIKQSGQGQAEWEAGTCKFSFSAPAPDPNNPYPDIGAITCYAKEKPAQGSKPATASASAFMKQDSAKAIAQQRFDEAGNRI